MRFAKAKQVSSRAASGAPAFYDWRPQATYAAIRLSYDVIDRLGADVMKGFWAVPKRGAEVGGILLGNVITSADGGTVVVVDDYERVSCEHRRGPSYVLSEADRKRLARSLRHGGERTVVGYFRSHTRPGLYLDENDMAVVGSFFSGPYDVVLLVRPHASGQCVAGFFIWEQGDMRRHATYQEFAFDTASLAEASGAAVSGAETADADAAAGAEAAEVAEEVESQAALIETEVPEEAVAPAANARVPEPRQTPAPEPRALRQEPVEARGLAALARDAVQRAAARPPRIRLSRPRAKTAVYAAMVIAALGLMEYQILAGRGHPEEENTAQVASLQVDRNGSYLSLRWNPDAPAVKNADRAVLSISEGGVRKEIQLDRAHLAEGMVAYSPSGNDVTFRLELHQHDRKLSEAVRVITGESQRPPQAKASEPAAKAPRATDVAAKPRRRSRAFFDDGL